MFERRQLLSGAENESLFLWGARQTGKSTLLKSLFPEAQWFDLLLADTYERLLRNPTYLRETVLALAEQKTVVIDEIQRIPELLHEIHWLMVNNRNRFILSGSSPRRILRSGTNLLGGRALRYELYPLVSAEIPEFDLMRALHHGMIPRHYLAKNPERLLSAYVGNYLTDEISTEARIRNLQVFAKFLAAAAFSNGEIVNYSNIATDCGISAPTVKEYFQILEHTLIGRFVQVFQKNPKRRVIQAPKFYLFDVGIANYILKRKNIAYPSDAFGRSFEHFIYQEIYAHSQYSGLEYPVTYWRTASQLEIDFVLGDHEIALEIKGSDDISGRHLKGLRTFNEEYTTKQSIVVCMESAERLVDGIRIMPWRIFLNRLWNGELMQ
jgi:predicted AAA+ superfamily ATPase